MTAKAIELLERLQTLPEHDQAAFTELFHQWEASQTMDEAPAAPEHPVSWPDFMARLREQWPERTPGKPLSEIVDEGRGPRP